MELIGHILPGRLSGCLETCEQLFSASTVALRQPPTESSSLTGRTAMRKEWTTGQLNYNEVSICMATGTGKVAILRLSAQDQKYSAAKLCSTL